MPKHILTFTLERETKGALRYFESDQIGNKMQKDYLIGTLYVRKDQVEGIPKKLNVEVEF